MTPRQRIEAECERRGRAAFVDGCVALLAGREVDGGLVEVLGGEAASWVVGGGETHAYWLRVWAARGLLWVWDDRALPVLLAALFDDAWRVREMAAKVVARHELGDAFEAVAALQRDPVARVRAAAARAAMRLTAAGA